MADKKANSTWVKFFKSAGIPVGYDTKYALIFEENRIKMDMLMDLNKELLKELGITAMGDIIAILKHAKKVYDETKEEAFEAIKSPSSPSSSTNILNSSPITPKAKDIFTKTNIKEVSSAIGIGNKPKLSAVRKFAPQREVKQTILSSNIKAKTSTITPSSSKSFLSKSLIKSPATIAEPKPIQVSTISPKTQITKTIRVLPTRDEYDSLEKKSNVVSISTKRGSTITLGSDPKFEKKIMISTKRSAIDETKTLKEEVPVQKKIRVLPEHEGKYKILMPESARNQRLLQNRGGLKSVVSKTKKDTIFDRLGESKVSSTSESVSKQVLNTRPTLRISVSSTDEKKPALASAASSSGGGTSSVFNRLGMDKTTSNPLTKEKDLSSMKFEVKQIVPMPVRSETTKMRHKPIVYDEKIVAPIKSQVKLVKRRDDDSFNLRMHSNSQSSSSKNKDKNIPSSTTSSINGPKEVSSPPIIKTSNKVKEEFKNIKITKRLEEKEKWATIATKKKITKVVKADHPELLAQASLEGNVIQTIRIPSATKGKVIVKKLIVKRIPKKVIREIDDDDFDYDLPDEIPDPLESMFEFN